MVRTIRSARCDDSIACPRVSLLPVSRPRKHHHCFATLLLRHNVVFRQVNRVVQIRPATTSLPSPPSPPWVPIPAPATPRITTLPASAARVHFQQFAGLVQLVEGIRQI